MLAFDDYMNSSKRTLVYGIKLSSLEIVNLRFFPVFISVDCLFYQLTDTHTHDKRLTLLHFIVQTIKERFSDVKRFGTHLQAVEKAAQVSLQNIQIDVENLTCGLDNAKNELVIYQTTKNVETRPSEEFLNIAQDKIDRLVKDPKSAQDSLNQCVESFAHHENEERKRLAREATATLDRLSKRQINKPSQVKENN
ncbi:unnamed protein product [Adineta steineri]|uniref:FH2 domain-containing protein n=1 Tax=Adineta steineri TaxID=433720 RepID=A0A814TMH4_9BILA|nr:unnamed protein product [Adineta steineri]